jgi:hypothetical protein
MNKINKARILPGGSFYFTRDELATKKEIETKLLSPSPIQEKGLKKPEVINIESDNLSDIPFIVLASSKKLTSERILRAGSGIIFQDLGQNNDLIISVNPLAVSNIVINVTSKGTGVNLNLPLSGSEISLRTLQGSGQLDIYNLGNTTILSAPRAVITTSSLGGVSMGLTVSAGTGNRNELLIRGLTGGGIVEVSALTNTIVISAAPFTQNITTSSFGTGAQIAIGVSGNREIHFRTITGTGVLDATTVGNVIQLSAPRAVITTSSLGGVSMGLAVSAVTGNRNELLIRGLTGGGIVEVSALTNTIVISAAPFIQNITTSSFGGGNQIAIGVSGNREIHFRTLVGGGGIEVSSTTDTIVISAAPLTQNITTSSFGTGAQIALGVSANREIQFRTLVGGGGIEVSATTDIILISATPGGYKDRIVGDILTNNYVTTSALNSSVHVATNGNVVLAITSAGMVGINTIEPSFIIDIHNTDPLIGPRIRFFNDTTSANFTAGGVIGMIGNSSIFEVSNYHTEPEASINFNLSEGLKFTINRDYIKLFDTSYVTYDQAGCRMAILKTVIPNGTNGVKTSFYLPNSAELVMPTYTMWSYEIDILASELDSSMNNYAVYKIKGISIRNDLPSTITALPVLEEIIYETSSALGWSCGVSANKSTGSLEIFALLSSYSGVNDVSWAAYIKIVELNLSILS